MISTEPLEAPIAASAQRELAETDPMLDRMISLAEHSQYIQAAELAMQLWQQQVYDVRTLGIYLFGVFVEQGLPMLPHILGCIESVVTTNWSYVGPSVGKQRHLDGALRWLFASLLEQLRFGKRGQGEQWKRSLLQWEQAPQPLILARLSQVATVVGGLVEGPGCQGSIYSLQAFLQALPTTKPSHPEFTSDGTSPQELGGMDVGEGDTADISAVGPPPGSLAQEASAQSLILATSFPLQNLIRRLAAFNRLVKLGKFKQAAIIYSDIKQSIEHFDPRVYLPSLFGEYFSNIVEHASQLTEGLKPKDGFVTEALMELYRIDIDLFMAAKT